MRKFKTVAALLDRKERWTKSAYARSKIGRVVDVTSKSAVRFCLIGAIERVYGRGENYISATNKLVNVINTERIMAFNDNDKTTFNMVRKAVRLAKI